MRDIYYFGTCLVDRLFYPQAGMAGIQLPNGSELAFTIHKNKVAVGNPL